jgi:precorrin-6Y C5,15-methyltransferase (decarboxylating)
VSIEAGLIVKSGQILAVEKNAARVEQIKSNKQRFGVTNMQVIQAVSPDGLSDLPRPDRVFIGGGGQALGGIIKTAARRLNPGGLIVVNTVILSNVNKAMEIFKQLAFDPGIVSVQISRGRQMPGGERLQAENPVFVISGRKPGEHRKDP